MPINNNIWELAEAYLAGSLPQADFLKLKNRLSADAEFAREFYEVTDMLRDVQNSGKQKRFRAMLQEVHMAEKGVKETTTTTIPVKKTAKRVLFPAHIWRTASVAAGVAILTSAITIWSLKPSIKKSDSQYNTISRQVEDLKKVQAQQQQQQNQLREDITKATTKPAPPPSDVYKTGTGFAITNDGYFVTSYHVLHDDKGYGDSVYIQNKDGQYFKASLVNFDAKADIAILRVEKPNFHFGKGELPYSFADEKAGLGARIFTLGFPKDEVVYSEGYISSRNGYMGNDLQYTLELPAGHGQSGSPIIDQDGDVLGILTAVGSQGEANTYAVSAKALVSLVHTLPDDKNMHLPKASKLGKLGREEQIEKMQAYTFSVKVYKK